MRLLLVTHYYSTHRGGVEMAARELAQRLVQNAPLEIEWMASDCDPSPEALPPAIRCVPAASWNGIERIWSIAYPLWSAGAVRELWRAVARSDAVHLHESLYMGNVLAFLFARRLGKPILVTQHVGAIPYRLIARRILSFANRTLARRVLSRANKVVFISPAVREYFSSFCSFRAAPVYVANGVDQDLFTLADALRGRELRRAAGRDPDRALCLFVGRFVPRKGIALLLALAKRLPEADWILAGDGPLRPEESAPPNLSIVRGRSGKAVAELYQMADLLVLPSTGEGFPLVVQEAMACGTPALVSPQTAAGCPQAAPYLLTEDLHGEDAVGRWSARLRMLSGDIESLRKKRAAIAAAAGGYWSWQRAARAYLDAFREIGAI